MNVVHNRRFGVAFCGAGPAAIGPVIAAARSGILQDFLRAGILFIESDVVGPGGMAHYRIPANSLGAAFLECLDELEGDVFDAVRQAPETAALRHWADRYPPLSVVAAFLRRLGDAVATLLRRHPDCAVVVGAAVRELDLRPAGDGVDIVAEATADGTQTTYTADRVVIAMGGRPMSDHDTAQLTPELSLAPYRTKVCHSESFVDQRRALPREMLAAIRDTGRVTIVGGAHSAWSVAALLLTHDTYAGPDGPPGITLLHRRPVRLFYQSAEEATADGYMFDPVLDVCAASGRVNRFGGLRGPAKVLAQAALGLGGTPVPVRLVHLNGGAPSVAIAEEALSSAGVVVSATGYQARLPRIRRSDGRAWIAGHSATGTLVDDRLRLVGVDGDTDPRLLGYGLGAGLTASNVVGGEPVYDRRADGVWLYQYDIGRTVLDELVEAGPAASIGGAVTAVSR